MMKSVAQLKSKFFACQLHMAHPSLGRAEYFSVCHSGMMDAIVTAPVK